jgi:hypothetical protein
MRGRPTEGEYAPFFAGYVGLVPEVDVLPALAAQTAELREVVRRAGAERETHRYAPGKWSVRQVFGHLGDAERVFGYRAFCISRGDQTALPAFDENLYVTEGQFDRQSLAELLDEFAAVRAVNLDVLRRLGDEAWRRRGTANKNPASVRALAYIMAGHVRHHVRVLAERYGVRAGA